MYRLDNAYVYLLMPAFFVVAYVMTLQFKLPWVAIFLAYGLIPKYDSLLKKDWLNPTLEQMGQLEQDQRFRAMLYITVGLEWAFLFRALNVVYYGEMPLWELLPFVYIMWSVSATGFLVAHELFHKNNRTDKVIGTPRLT